MMYALALNQALSCIANSRAQTPIAVEAAPAFKREDFSEAAYHIHGLAGRIYYYIIIILSFSTALCLSICWHIIKKFFLYIAYYLHCR